MSPQSVDCLQFTAIHAPKWHTLGGPFLNPFGTQNSVLTVCHLIPGARRALSIWDWLGRLPGPPPALGVPPPPPPTLG